MKKSKFIWLDGELVDWDNANVSVMTHTLHYGTGVFEGMRARDTDKGTSVQFLDDHVDRLYRSAEAYNLEIPFNKNVISNAIKEIVKVNNLKSAYIRPLVFFGDGEMGLLPQNIPVRVAIAAWEWGAYLGDDAGSKGVNVCISDWQRISPKSFKPFAKGVGGYMNSTLAKIDAVKQGFDDAIMLSDNGTVAEGSGQNIFIYKNNQLLTPPIETGALGGITRKMVMEIAHHIDIPVVEQDLSPADLIASDEIFFTGTATEIVGVVSVDNNKISDGSVGAVSYTHLRAHET